MKSERNITVYESVNQSRLLELFKPTLPSFKKSDGTPEAQSNLISDLALFSIGLGLNGALFAIILRTIG